MQKENFFDRMYKNADKNNLSAIPWATLSANVYLVKYLSTQSQVQDKRALVIGCGLGDDALALEAQGYTVDAMDISPSAIALAKERHSESNVHFYVADIYDMPKESFEAYNFVYEGLTVQSLPREDRETIIATIAGLVKKGGTLLVYASMQADADNYGGPPWPLYEREFALYETHGLVQKGKECEEEVKVIAAFKCCRVYSK